ncbi:hypothetical protein V8E53_004452 [Lactarius tabidus]
MAPHTRRSHTKGPADSTQGKENEGQVPLQSSTLVNTKICSKVAARRVDPESQSQSVQSALGKRTYIPTQTPSDTHGSTPEFSDKQAKTVKKARNIGPAHGHPMPLLLPGGSEVESGEFASNNGDFTIQQRKAGSVVKGKRVELECTSSFYPGCGDNTHVLARLDHRNPAFHAPAVDIDDIETDKDSEDDVQVVELALKYPNKFSESVANERPSWVLSGTSEPEKSGSQSSAVSLNDSVRSTGAGVKLSVVATRPKNTALPGLDVPRAGWPIDTDLIFAVGSTKLSLLNQRPIVHTVIQEAIENLRAALLFANAFPDVCSALTLIKDCLFTAALHLKPGATEVLDRLTRDQEYLLKMTPLLRARICLIRSEIKDRCNAITMNGFLVFGSALDTIEYVCKQLSHYTYTFPRATMNNAPNVLVMCSRPYRNDRIITVIRDMFFVGGAASFAHNFQYLFPTYEIADGEIVLEVPIPMVALVATALYAALYEWRTGDHQLAEFSANAYLDVYQGHVNTLNHIRERREGVFHLMMVDIYKQANTLPIGNEPSPAVQIAEIDLDNLDS